jgi:hypothetical protein
VLNAGKKDATRNKKATKTPATGISCRSFHHLARLFDFRNGNPTKRQMKNVASIIKKAIIG